MPKYLPYGLSTFIGNGQIGKNLTMRFYFVFLLSIFFGSLFAQSPSNPFDKYFQEGSSYYDQQNYLKARESFLAASKEALKQYGFDSYENRNVAWYLTYIYIALDDARSAKESYTTVTKINVEVTEDAKSGLVKLTEELADYFGRKGQLEQAILYHKKAFRQHTELQDRAFESQQWNLKKIIDHSLALNKVDSISHFYRMIAEVVPAGNNLFASNIRDWTSFAIGSKSQDVFDQIEKKCEEFLNAKSAKNEKDLWYAETWYQYGRIQKTKGQHERAMNAFGEAKKTIAVVIDPSIDQVLNVHYQALETINQSKKFDHASDIWAVDFEKANEPILTSDPKEYCENMAMAFMYYFYRQQYNKAEVLIEKILPIYANAVGKDSRDYKVMELSYRGIIEKTGHTEKLRNLGGVKALTENETLQALDLKDAKSEIEQLGQMIGKGNYLGAVNLFEKRQKVFDDYFASINDYETYILSMLTVASLHRELGNLRKAEAILLEAEKKSIDKLEKGHFTAMRTLTSLGVFYQQVGAYADAEKKFITALDVLNETRNNADSLKNDEVYYETLSYLGSLYAKWGYYEDAEKALLDVLRYQRRFHKEESKEVVLAKVDVADLYRVMEYLSWAEMIYKECEPPMKKMYGENNIRYISFINSLAANYQLRGMYRDAEPLYAKAKDFYLANLGSKSDKYIGVVTDMAMMYFHLGESKKAKDQYKILNDLLLYKVDNFFPALSEKEKTVFYTATALSLNTYNSFALQYSKMNGTEANEMYDLQLVTKGMLFKATNKMRQTVANSKDDSLKYFYTRWINTKNDLAKIYQMNASQKQAANINEKQMEGLANSLEKKISARSELFNNIIDKRVTWQAIKKNLRSGEAAVEIVRVRNAQPEYTFAYMGKGVTFDTLGAGGYMQVTELASDRCSASKSGIKEWDVFTSINGESTKGKNREQLSDLMAAEVTKIMGKRKDGNTFTIELKTDSVFRRQFVRNIVYAALIITPELPNVEVVLLPNGDQLESRYVRYYTNMIKTQSADQYSYQQFWEPIKSKLGKKTRVYLSPDGVYNSINLNTLYNPASGKYLIDETEVVIVGNTSDILTKKQSSKSNQAVLLGFPDYYLKSIQPGAIANVDTTYSILAKDTAQRFMNGSTITELPGTNVEVNTIAAVMKALKFDVRKYTSSDASEEKIKNVSSPRILHIATHGFFLNTTGDAGSRGITGVTAAKLKENPLLRSGLLLAGAGKTISGQAAPNTEDGILTAYEAMNLDLNDTELVVMSACETGLGEIKSGEGVYGLQRAFRSAGAESILMSLWKVDDRATQELMSVFYKQWLSSSDKQSSFRQAQLNIRNRFSHPYYWGAFVMVGQ
jgi:CHAT domain-containing protein